MINCKRFLFTADSTTIIITLFQIVPFSFCVLSFCALFSCITPGFQVGNGVWMSRAIVFVIYLLAFSILSDSFIRILFVERERVLPEIRITLARTKVSLCLGIMGTPHAEALAAIITDGEKVIRKSGTYFCSCFCACFMTWLKSFDPFWHINHLTIIIAERKQKINIHDNPELLE